MRVCSSEGRSAYLGNDILSVSNVVCRQMLQSVVNKDVLYVNTQRAFSRLHLGATRSIRDWVRVSLHSAIAMSESKVKNKVCLMYVCTPPVSIPAHKFLIQSTRWLGRREKARSQGKRDRSRG